MRQTQRLDKVLSTLGYGTRKEIKRMVRDGAVSIDGIEAKDSGMHIDPEQSVIEVNGEVLKYKRFVYIMMNKPEDAISATFDNKHTTVIDILPDQFKKFNLFPVGRLDIDTEGLLLLTNDGQMAHNLLSPKKRIPKKYYALIEGEVTTEDAAKFKEGIELDDSYKTLPADLFILRQGDCSEIEIIIFEGKFHQVKRMFEAVGKKVKYLRRIEMGTLKLDAELKTGECRELTEDELEALYRKEKL